jgi:superfamily I DNA and/or RNA helicase
VDIVAGTSWLYARPDLRGLDVLVIDEAGQLSLANVLAISSAAESLVLLGDPQQLSQPVQGQHPPGAGVSALEHLLDGRASIPADRGIFLDTTWRMHPDIAAFVSTASYKNRLLVEPGCARQSVQSGSQLGGTGLRLITVEHHDNSAASSEEADVIRQLCRDVLADGYWTDREGNTRELGPADLLILSPFNAQVNRIRNRLGAWGAGIRVGTVDRFQGQEAPVVIYSTASSTAQDAPRGVEFLYSQNRFNVAISRARGVVAVVCSPALLTAPVRTPEQLAMVNALCAYAEAADASTASSSTKTLNPTSPL